MIKITLMKGHVLDCLKKIPDESIDTVITSPPYFHLRKYPEEANVVWSEDKNCEHDFELYEKSGLCKKCGAWFGQLGLEPYPELYLQHLKQVMIEIKRVLKPTGTVFWNMNDTYIVLDPFLGSGTTMKVAIEERRNCIGIEAVEEYCKMAMRRCNLPNPFIDFEYLKID